MAVILMASMVLLDMVDLFFQALMASSLLTVHTYGVQKGIGWRLSVYTSFEKMDVIVTFEEYL